MKTTISPTQKQLISLLHKIIREILAPLKKPGPKPTCSDAQLFTLAIIQELRGIESQSEFVRRVSREMSWFTQVPCQQEYNRRLNENEELLKLVQKELAGLVTLESEGTGYADTAPVPITKYCRKPKGPMSSAKKGYCASKKMYYYGKKLFLLISQEGIPLLHFLAEANPHDCKLLTPENLQNWNGHTIVGDLGFILKQEDKLNLWRKKAITTITPYRKNQKKKNSFEEKQLLRNRKEIERRYSSLERKMNLDRTLAQSFTGLSSRISQKILSVTAAMLLNSFLNFPLAQISHLLL